MRIFWMALGLKIIGPWVAIWSVLPWYTGASYWTSVVYATWFAGLGFLIGDLYVVRRFGNIAGTLLDVGLAAALLPILVRKPVPWSGWLWLLLSVAVVEYVYHYIVVRRQYLR